MSITLFGFGHQNISAKHLTTIEFTSAPDISPRGDCIVACRVKSDVEELKKMTGAGKKLRITIKADDISDVVECTPNPAFNYSGEIVLRMSSISTHRTFGINADKGARMLKRDLIEKLKNPEQQVIISVEKAIEKG